MQPKALGSVPQFTYELEHIYDNIPAPHGNCREINKQRLALIEALQKKVRARIKELQPFIILAKSDRYYRAHGVPNPRHAKQFSEMYPEYIALRELHAKIARKRNTALTHSHEALGYTSHEQAIWIKQYWANRKASENATT